MLVYFLPCTLVQVPSRVFSPLLICSRATACVISSILGLHVAFLRPAVLQGPVMRGRAGQRSEGWGRRGAGGPPAAGHQLGSGRPQGLNSRIKIGRVPAAAGPGTARPREGSGGHAGLLAVYVWCPRCSSARSHWVTLHRIVVIAVCFLRSHFTKTRITRFF